MAFSPTSAALEGFRLIGRRPFSILVWTVFYALTGAALLALACVLFSPTLVGEILRHHGEVGFSRRYEFDDFNEFAQYFQGLGLAALGLFAALLVVASIQLCAVYRAVLRPQDRGLAYLRLGGDELRQIVLMLLMGLFFGIVSGGLTGGLAAGLMYADLGTGANIALCILGGVVLLVLVIMLGVRLSLAGPMTFAERRIRFFGSWGLTRGSFWRLVAMYLLSIIFCIVVMLALDAVAQGAAALLGFNIHSMFIGDNFAFDFEDFTLEDVASVVGWGGLAYVVISTFSSVLQTAIAYAPQAAAYRDLTADRAPPAPMNFAETPDGGPAPDHGPGGHADSHDGHGAQAALAGAAVAAGAMGVAAAVDHAHAEDHGHAAPETHAETHAEPHAEPHADHGAADAHAPAEAHGEAHAEAPVHAFTEPAVEHAAAAPEPVAADHTDHGHAEAAPADYAPAHAPEPAAEHVAAADHAPAHADHGHEPAEPGHAEPHAEAHAETHAEPHGDPHAGHAPEAHPEPHPEAPSAAPVEHHAEAHPAEPEAHPAAPHHDTPHPGSSSEH